MPQEILKSRDMKLRPSCYVLKAVVLLYFFFLSVILNSYLYNFYVPSAIKSNTKSCVVLGFVVAKLWDRYR